MVTLRGKGGHGTTSEDESLRELAHSRMVDEQLAGRGIRDRRVLDAMRRVPRHLFVPEGHRHRAYDDRPLPVGHGQTISQPYMVAVMVELLELEPEERALDIGTGSGYQAAVLDVLARDVITVERVPDLAHAAARALWECGAGLVRVVVGDGSRPTFLRGKFDGIIVAAASPRVPGALREALTVGGRLVLPVGERKREQVLMRVIRVSENEWTEQRFFPCTFVPLIGEEGWK